MITKCMVVMSRMGGGGQLAPGGEQTNHCTWFSVSVLVDFNLMTVQRAWAVSSCGLVYIHKIHITCLFIQQ